MHKINLPVGIKCLKKYKYVQWNSSFKTVLFSVEVKENFEETK